MAIDSTLPTGSTPGSTQSSSASSLSQLSSNLDNFLKILTTQLQHQDPLSPMDTHEFTNQLVQFASVEQQIQGNRNLEALISLQETGIMVGAVSYIGKQVEVTGQTAMLEDGSAEFIYTLPEDATAAILAVYDENGTQVLFKQAEKDAGRHAFIWDGKDGKGAAMPDGKYTIQIVAVNEANEAITPAYSITGTVAGVGIEDGKATLSLGSSLDVPLANVVRIVDQNGESG
jgi:flagellar basal-body rod modification protein FlgD